MPYVRRRYQSGFGSRGCTCDYEGANCSACSGYEYEWEDNPKPKIRKKASECFILYDEVGNRIGAVVGNTNIPEFIYSYGTVYRNVRKNIYQKIQAPTFDDVVDEIV